MFVYLYHVCPRNNPQPLHCGAYCTDLDRTAQVNSTSILWRIFFDQILPVIKGWKTSYLRARLYCNTMLLYLIHHNKVWKKAENRKTMRPHIPLCRSKQASSTLGWSTSFLVDKFLTYWKWFTSGQSWRVGDQRFPSTTMNVPLLPPPPNRKLKETIEPKEIPERCLIPTYLFYLATRNLGDSPIPCLRFCS